MSRRDEEEAAISEVLIGTPLEPLNKDNMPSKKPKQLEDQVVKDEQGRRRFHGAFTGGFSAGYYNTVGTKEGWTPSSFKSSRSSKMEKKTQSIRDFLDEEDIGQFGFAPETMRARDTFEKQTDNVKRKQTFQEPLLSGSSILDSVLKPSKETFGVHILMKMGWKPGQGIGPRLNYAEKKRKIKEQKSDSTKVYGCALPPGYGEEDGGSDGESEKYEDITFAPDDIPVCLMKPKENLFGLGYKGLDRHSVLSAEKSSAPLKLYTKHNKESKIGISGQAFGVGAYEEDDEDIYSTEDLSQYDVVLGGQGDSQKKARLEKKADILRPVTKIVDGFIQGSNATLCKTVFRPLSVPKGFVPMHKPPTPIPTQLPPPNSAHKTQSRHTKSASDRKKILDDPIEPQMVVATQPVNLPIINTPTFSKDRHKQERYELFVSLIKQGKKDEFAAHQPESFTDWEKDREQLEFEKSMEFFKPMSSGIASRFVSAGIVHDGLEQADQLSLAMQKPDVKTPRQEAAERKQYGKLTRDKVEWHPDKLLCKRFNITNPYPGSEIVGTLRPVRVDPMLDFLKQYKPVVIKKSNSLTESSSNKEPKTEPLKNEESLKSALPIDSNRSVVNNNKAEKAPLQPVKPAMIIDSITSPRFKSSSSVLEPPTQVEEKLQNRPPVDFFKAIFEDSDDDDELPPPAMSDNPPPAHNKDSAPTDISATVRSEKKSVLTPEGVTNDKTPDLTKVKSEKVTKSGSKRKHGVFSDIDFDLLNKPTEPDAKKPIIVPASHENSDKDNSVYGPAIPPNLSSLPKSSNSGSTKKHKKSKIKKSKLKKSKHRKKSKNSSDEGYLEISLDKKLKTLIKKLI